MKCHRQHPFFSLLPLVCIFQRAAALRTGCTEYFIELEKNLRYNIDQLSQSAFNAVYTLHRCNVQYWAEYVYVIIRQ